jgi:hypothetical protein
MLAEPSGLAAILDGLCHDVTTGLHAHNSIDILRTKRGSPAWSDLQGLVLTTLTICPPFTNLSWDQYSYLVNRLIYPDKVDP